MSTPTPPTDSESLAAEKLAQEGSPAADVLTWLHESHFGVLSTLNIEKAAEGFPTGSIVPFALDHLGRPFVFIADIALHTRNLKKDNRASLFIHKQAAAGDPQSHWRISLRGCFTPIHVDTGTEMEDGEQVSEDAWERLMARYVERVPKARSYAQMHGFRFWRMDIQSIRYIKGFGRICTFSGEDYLDLVGEDAHKEMREGALSHMNEDHEENMKEICRAFFGVAPETVSMSSLDMTGCLLETGSPKAYHYCSFANAVMKPAAFKSEIIALLRRARQSSKKETHGSN